MRILNLKKSREFLGNLSKNIKPIWAYMLKDKVKYGISENVVEGAEISAPKRQYLEDYTFLYLVVMSMIQGLR